MGFGCKKLNCLITSGGFPLILAEQQTGLLVVADYRGHFCQKCKTGGVGWVYVKNSNRYGMAGWYPMRAMKEGFVGISMTNTSPLIAPTRVKEVAPGTNPIAVGVPAGDDQFLLDMARTAIAVGKIEIQRRKGENIPEGWAQNAEGALTTDLEEACCLMPLGSAELNSGYKGYGNVKKLCSAYAII
uniref:Uncharacterized protein n=1 Tax=Glossina austeni TaxID=7395 RepID=A0A1A9UIQ2_GLOAU